MSFVKSLAVLALGVVAGAALAGSDPAATVTSAIQKLVPQAHIQAVAPAPIPGFSSAVVDGDVLYVSNDGRYLMQGKLYDLQTRTDLGAGVLASIRDKVLKDLPAGRELSFPAKDAKYTVTAFVDVDCPYCRHMHAQIAEFNQRGISVNYVLFPLDGLHPQATRKAIAVWCAKDRDSAYSAAMAGADPGNATCENPIADNLQLGQKLGVHYTPTVLMADGTEIPPGVAQSPDQMLALLQQHAK